MVYFTAEGDDEHHVVRLRQVGDQPRRRDRPRRRQPRRRGRAARQGGRRRAARSSTRRSDLDSARRRLRLPLLLARRPAVRNFARRRARHAREVERWEGDAAEDQPHRPAFARPQGGGDASSPTCWASASATGWATSCASCAATRRITASRSCPGRRASTMSPTTCSSVDDMMRGISRLRSSGIDIRWGPGRHTAGNNTFSYFVTPERLRGRIYVRAGGGGFRDA